VKYERVSTTKSRLRGRKQQLCDFNHRLLHSLFSDIDSLAIYGGIHAKVYGLHRSLSRRFPFAIYYDVQADEVQVHAVLDCRRKPSWIRKRLQRKN
jgi:hypothetical protein